MSRFLQVTPSSNTEVMSSCMRSGTYLQCRSSSDEYPTLTSISFCPDRACAQYLEDPYWLLYKYSQIQTLMTSSYLTSLDKMSSTLIYDILRSAAQIPLPTPVSVSKCCAILYHFALLSFIRFRPQKACNFWDFARHQLRYISYSGKTLHFVNTLDKSIDNQCLRFDSSPLVL